MKRARFGVFSNVGAFPLAFFLLVPLIALVVKGWNSFVPVMQTESARSACWVSLKTTGISLLLDVVLGVPVAWVLAFRRGLGVRLLDAVTNMPVVLPPSVAGIALLVAFGRNGLIPTHLPFSVGAVVCAQLFVSAPLFIQSAKAAFCSVAAEVLESARAEGAGSGALLRLVLLPIGAPLLVSGAALAWARSLGEFGATLLFAGNLEGRTQTLPLAIYLGFESDFDEALGLSLLLMIAAGVVLLATRFLIRFGKE